MDNEHNQSVPCKHLMHAESLSRFQRAWHTMWATNMLIVSSMPACGWPRYKVCISFRNGEQVHLTHTEGHAWSDPMHSMCCRGKLWKNNEWKRAQNGWVAVNESWREYNESYNKIWSWSYKWNVMELNVVNIKPSSGVVAASIPLSSSVLYHRYLKTGVGNMRKLDGTMHIVHWWCSRRNND